MEINLNSNGFGNVGMGRGMPEATGAGAARETANSAPASRLAALHVSSPSSNVQSAALASAEPVADVPDAELVRDDALGQLVKAAFNLPPPPMPAFTG